jgi:hypothetical protein
MAQDIIYCQIKTFSCLNTPTDMLKLLLTPGNIHAM